MGLFFYTKIGSIISIGDLPTTNIIEPIKIRSSKAFALEFFFGLSDRLGTDLVFLGTGEI